MSTLYTPQVPPVTSFRNADLNSLASTYASTHGHNTSALIQRIVKELIYDAAPQQFFDLKLLGMKPMEQIQSDEWYYHEMGFGREAIIATAVSGAAAAQTVTVSNTDFIAVDTIVVYPDNTKGIVTAVNTAASTIDVATYSGGANLTAVAIGDSFAVLSPVEADGMDSISQYFRIDTVEKHNFVQMLVKAIRFGKMELYKYQNAGTTSNYLSMQKQRMLQQFRIDMSNVLWNGTQGEVTLANGMKAKTTGGLFPIMVAAGSPSSSTTIASLPQAVEQLALDTEFKALGHVRFLYATPRMLHNLSQEYKRTLTRYAPDDEVAKLDLKAIDMGSSKIVFVPMKRFEEPSCFPSVWANRLILLDQESVSCVRVFPDEMGETLNREDGSLNNFTDYWISTTMGVQFNNPLGSGYIDVT